MSKLIFRYGTMGSAKTAQALMKRYNYEEKGIKVWLIKPSTDTRDDRADGVTVIRSRIGLEAQARAIGREENIEELFRAERGCSVIICDESQFLTPKQVEELKAISSEYGIPVLCYGLRTDFQTHLFQGSQRLFELADEIGELQSVCACGEPACVNARIDAAGHIVREGEQIVLGGNDRYVSMCWRCWKKGK